MKRETLEPTQLRELYDALGSLKEQEQTALAELHAEDPERLIARFAHSVKTVAGYSENLEPFHGRGAEVDQAVLDSSVPITEIKKTEHVASHLVGDRLHEVEGAPAFAFRYVDREIFALRNTTAAGPRPARRSLDLLLGSQDGLPIVAELKIRGDKPTYFALIQALMYAAELSSPAQRARLRKSFEFFHDTDALSQEEGPFLDLYLIAFEPPQTGKFRERSFAASEEISAELIEDVRINSVLRRIAYIEAVAGNDGLSFTKSFSFSPSRK